MNRLLAILLALFLCAPINAAFPQSQLSAGDNPSPKPDQPIPYSLRGLREAISPQQCPDGTAAALNTCGDGEDGYHWQFDSFNQKLEFRPPKILYGPGAITVAAGLTQNAWNNLYGAVGAHGFRSGLTAYIPRGNYMGFGQVSFATGATANPTYTIRVLMGTCDTGTGAQKGILVVPQVATNGATAAGAVDGVNNVLSFANGTTTCIIPGMVVYDVTAAAAIAAQIVVCSVTATTIKLTAASSYPTCNASGFVAAPGVGNGDTIMFGFVSGYGGPYTWPGGAGLSFTMPYFFTTAALGCLASTKNQQCEMLTQVFTTSAGASVAAAGGQVTNPPYSTSFNIMRMDGGYGAQ